MIDKDLLKLEDKKFLANKTNRAENTKQIIDKLDEIKPKDPVPFPEKVKMELVNEPNDLAKAFFSMLKGEKGDTPTEDELIELIKPLIPEPIPGEDGEDGKDYVLTPEDKKEIASKIKVPVVEKVIEKTEVIKEQPIEIVKEVAVSDSGIEIAKKLTELKGDDRLDIESLKGLGQVINEAGNNFLQQAKGFVSKTLAGQADVNIPNPTNGQILTYNKASGKWIASNAGSGSGTVQSVVAGTGISVDSTDPANPIVSATGGGGFTELAATGTVDGSNTSFTFTQEPTYIVSDHAWYKATNKNGTTNWTWNGVDTATMTVAPTEDIFGVA